MISGPTLLPAPNRVWHCWQVLLSAVQQTHYLVVFFARSMVEVTPAVALAFRFPPIDTCSLAIAAL